jgi:hypothetical protein
MATGAEVVIVGNEMAWYLLKLQQFYKTETEYYKER